jgi:hypothetical protein
MGLSKTVTHTRVFHSSQWWNRQLCHSGHCLFHVCSRSRCRPKSREVDSCVLLLMKILTNDGTRTDEQVIADARRLTGEPEDSSYIPSDPREFSNRIFHTCYMGTENSSVETRRRAKQLSEAIGRYVDNYSINRRCMFLPS